MGTVLYYKVTSMKVLKRRYNWSQKTYTYMIVPFHESIYRMNSEQALSHSDTRGHPFRFHYNCP